MDYLQTLPRSILELILKIEVAAVELTGSRRQLRPETNDNERRPLLALRSAEEEEASEDSTSSQILRVIIRISVVVLLILLEAGYYVCHADFELSNSTKGEEKIIDLSGILDLLLLPLLLSFWLVAPIHTALGYFTDDRSIENCQQHMRMFVEDGVSQKTTMVYGLAVLLSTACECSFFVNRQQRVPPVLILYYVVSVLINILTIYTSILLATLSFRVIVMPLELVEGEVTAELRLHKSAHSSVAMPKMRAQKKQNQQYASVETIKAEALAQKWLHYYQSMRENMHQLSDRFGAIMLAGLMLYLLEVFNVAIKAGKLIRGAVSLLDVTLLLVVYLVNAAVLSIAFHHIAFPTTMCTHHVGPNMCILAAKQSRSEERTSGKGLDMLAQTFVLAPIQLHLGNFHMTPSIADAVQGGFVVLFLVACGLRVPEV